MHTNKKYWTVQLVCIHYKNVKHKNRELFLHHFSPSHSDLLSPSDDREFIAIRYRWPIAIFSSHFQKSLFVYCAHQYARAREVDKFFPSHRKCFFQCFIGIVKKVFLFLFLREEHRKEYGSRNECIGDDTNLWPMAVIFFDVAIKIWFLIKIVKFLKFKNSKFVESKIFNFWFQFSDILQKLSQFQIKT